MRGPDGPGDPGGPGDPDDNMEGPGSGPSGPDDPDDPDNNVADRIAAAPMSDFERQVVSDHPELSVAESRVVANMLLTCAEYAAQVVPRYIAYNPGKVINRVVGSPKP